MTPGRTEYSIDLYSTILQHGIQSWPYQRAVKPVPERRQRQRVINPIDQFHPSVDLDEPVLVMPEAIRAKSLLVDEPLSALDMRDFSDPRHRDREEGRHPVSEQHPRIDGALQFGRDDELELRRGQAFKVARIREEAPNVVESGRDPLSSGEEMNLQGRTRFGRDTLQ